MDQNLALLHALEDIKRAVYEKALIAAQLQQVAQENQQLKARVAELEAQVSALKIERGQVNEDGNETH